MASHGFLNFRSRFISREFSGSSSKWSSLSPQTLPPDMPSRSGRILRRLFRWICRVLVLLILALLVTAVYLEKAGVPEFVKRRLIDEIRARGWEVEFSRLRFHWYRGVVAENVILKRFGQRPGPLIFVDEAACQFDRRQFHHLEFHPLAVTLRGGRIVWQLRETNQPTATVQLDHVGGELDFKPNDVWELRSLRAEVLGSSVQLAGTVTNASVVREIGRASCRERG